MCLQLSFRDSEEVWVRCLTLCFSLAPAMLAVLIPWRLTRCLTEAEDHGEIILGLQDWFNW